MRPQYTLPSSPPMPYVFQRLERIKERLTTESLPTYLDASRKAWYTHLMATHLAQHLLEAYRQQVEITVGARGIEAIAPHHRAYFTILPTTTGTPTVQLHLNPHDVDNVHTTLSQSIERSDEASVWNTMEQRLATDLSTWALEQVTRQQGDAAIAAMPPAVFEDTLLCVIRNTAPEILVSERINQFFEQTAQHVAFDLANMVTARQPSLAELEYLLGFRDTAPPHTRIQPLLREEHLTVLSAAHYQALREALAFNTFERHDGVSWPTASLTKGSARGHAQLRPLIIDRHPLMPPEEIEAWATRMWQQRENLSDLDADALDSLSALWLYQAHTPEEDAVADVDELLSMRGLRPKRSGQGREGGFRPAQRHAMLEALSHIQNLWVNMSEVDIYEERTTRTGARRRKTSRQAIQSRAFTITDLFGQVRLDGGMDVEKFIFRPGKVFAHFLFGPGRQTAMLSAKALHYDPLRQTWEKRLARYLSYQWRCRAHVGNYQQPFRVATLLAAVDEALDERRPMRTRERLEKALDALHREGLIASWQYERWDENLLEHRGWAHHWCQATILIEPPDIIREIYHSLEKHETSRVQLPDAAIALGQRIGQRRQALGLSQMQAAEQLGVNQSYLSRLESGKVRRVSIDQQRLTSWLDEDVTPSS